MLTAMKPRRELDAGRGTCNAPDIDDTSAFLHVRESCLDEDEWTSNIDSESRVPLIEPDGFDSLDIRRREPGVVDNDIDGVGIEGLQGGINQRFAEVGARGIGFDGNRLNSKALDLTDDFLCWSGGAVVMDQHLRSSI